MKKTRFIIPGQLGTLNEMIDEARANKYKSANKKRQYTNLVAWAIKQAKLRPINIKVDVVIKWYCPSKRKDKDNIMAGQKYIFDGLQLAGIIPNDGWNEIGDISHKFYVDKQAPRIEVELLEINKEEL